MPSKNLRGSLPQRNRLKKLIAEYPKIVGEETRELAARVQVNAQSRAPYETGALRRGIKITNTKRGTFRISVHAYNKRTGYDYSGIQHNNPNYNHKIGEYLFITKAMKEELDTFEQRVKRRLKLK